MNRAPCTACEKRYVGCHADCEEYKSWKADVLEKAENQRNYLKAEKMIYSYVSGVKRKLTRKANKEK